MKIIHLLLIALVVGTFGLATFSGNTYAAADKKEVAATADKVKKEIPHNVNINTADKELLTQLPGIGPVTAETIVQYRQDNGQFKSVDDLTKVKGIGNKTLAKLKPYLSNI